jgi:thiol-disulfide isomerase/thioredoxin
MKLETMEPNPVWTKEAFADSVDVLRALNHEVTYKVWGGDWCKDCRSQLPDFAAALDAADVPSSRIEHFPTEKEDDGSKTGPMVDEYDIDRIPTVVVERNGEEIARFVESEPVPITVYLARELEALT